MIRSESRENRFSLKLQRNFHYLFCFDFLVEYELIVSKAEMENVLNLVAEFRSVTRYQVIEQPDTTFDEEEILNESISQAINDYGLQASPSQSIEDNVPAINVPGPSNPVYNLDDSSNSLSINEGSSSKIEDQIEIAIEIAINTYGLKCSEVPRN